MKKSVELTIRASEIRSEINALEPGDGSLEKRRELLASLNTVESEWRTAVADEAKADAAAPDTSGLTGEEREFRQLETKAELRQAFKAVMSGNPLTGPEKELQEHRGLSGHSIPWDLVGPRAAPRTEDRADAVSSAPADSHLQQHPILARVFARSATATLGVAMPMVATGEQNFPVVTTTDSAVILAKDAAEGDTADAGIVAKVIEPTRLQRSYVFRREDQAVLGGLEEALRADLSMSVSDLLDAQVLAGDGTTGAQFGGFLALAANGGLTDRSDTPARVTFALAAAEAARGHRRQVCRPSFGMLHRDRRRRRPRSGKQIPDERFRKRPGLHGPFDHEDDGVRERSRRGGDVPRGHHCPHGRVRR